MREIPPSLYSFQRAARVVHKSDILSELRTIGINQQAGVFIDSIKANQILQYAKYLGFETQNDSTHYSITDEGNIVYSNTREDANKFRLHNNIHMGGIIAETDPNVTSSIDYYDGDPDVLESALIYVIDKLEELPEDTVSYGPLFMLRNPKAERTPPKGDLSSVPRLRLV